LRNGFREAIEVRPRPDGVLLWFVAALGCAAGISVGLADVPPAWKAGALLVVGAMALGNICRRRDTRSDHYVARAVLFPDGDWTIFCGNVELMDACLGSAWGTRLGPVVALEWRCDDGRRRQAWLLKQDLGPLVWRRLRVRLSLS
jgi:hypothetical protein